MYYLVLLDSGRWYLTQDDSNAVSDRDWKADEIDQLSLVENFRDRDSERVLQVNIYSGQYRRKSVHAVREAEKILV